jgi:hypothetical protein
MLVNTAIFNFAGPLSARLHAEKATLSAITIDTADVTQKGGSCGNLTSTELGSYTIPDVDLTPGSNSLHFATDMALMNMTSWTEGLIIPVFMRRCSVVLTIASDDVSMIILGVKHTGLRIKRQLTCSPARTLLQQQDICGPASKEVSGRRLHDNNGYTLHCTDALRRNLTMVV